LLSEAEIAEALTIAAGGDDATKTLRVNQAPLLDALHKMVEDKRPE
jgi:hypothetical protein